MEVFNEVIGIVGMVVQFLGLIIFGIAVGWFTVSLAKGTDQPWQLKSIVYSVFLVFVALMGSALTPGAFGSLLLGAACAIIFWGMIKDREKPAKKK
jgi:hypothetical protein